LKSDKMSNKSKQLLVEGVDDLLAVVGLMEHHVPWPRDKHKAPVWINAVGSVDEIFDPTYLSTKLKESGLEVLGIMVDADDQPGGRWATLCTLCRHAVPTLPKNLPPEGLIVDCTSGLRLGFWMMPDCSSDGMLETFLRHLVPTSSDAVWTHAQKSSVHARTLGAPYRDAHSDKAYIHTWLGWQDPPGERLGIALTRKILDANASTATPFVKWFKALYGLPNIDTPTEN
jgi:hypothetical protein